MTPVALTSFHRHHYTPSITINSEASDDQTVPLLVKEAQLKKGKENGAVGGKTYVAVMKSASVLIRRRGSCSDIGCVAELFPFSFSRAQKGSGIINRSLTT